MVSDILVNSGPGKCLSPVKCQSINWTNAGILTIGHLITKLSVKCRPLCPHLNELVNTLRQRQNGRHFSRRHFKRNFFNENVWILIKISLKFVSKSSIDNIPALVQIMACRYPGDKPLSEPMMVSLPTHICVTRLQRVNPQLLPISFLLPVCSPSAPKQHMENNK